MADNKMVADEKCEEEMLACGQIVESDSPGSVTMIIVTKRMGSTRFCVDYRKWNSVTVKDVICMATCSLLT